jgi:hypothetical protein
VEGELKKMLIEAHKKPDYSDGVAASFKVMFNPNGYTKKYELQYHDAQGAGSTSSPQVFGKIKPQDYTFEFLFDGTGTTTDKIDVHEQIELFLQVTGKHDGEIHRPKYLKLSWGALILKCVLKSAEITYSLFHPDGKPLRAKVKATFSENIEETLRVAKEKESSPDLTHIRTVTSIDNLPLMTYSIYNDPSYYLQVARFNNLKSIRHLSEGSEIRFPPVSIKSS